jgi:hypothetical protein
MNWRLAFANEGWNSDSIRQLQAIGLLNPRTVHANLALAQYGVDFLLWHTLEPAHQKIIDALTYIIFVRNVDEGDTHLVRSLSKKIKGLRGLAFTVNIRLRISGTRRNIHVKSSEEHGTRNPLVMEYD